MTSLSDKYLNTLVHNKKIKDEFNDYEVLTKGRLRWRLAVASYLRQ